MIIPRLRRNSRAMILASGLFMLVLSQSGVLASNDDIAGQCTGKQQTHGPFHLVDLNGQQNLGVAGSRAIAILSTID